MVSPLRPRGRAGCILGPDGGRGPCSTDDGGFGYGADGRSLGGGGVVTSWVQGGDAEAGARRAAGRLRGGARGGPLL